MTTSNLFAIGFGNFREFPSKGLQTQSLTKLNYFPTGLFRWSLPPRVIGGVTGVAESAEEEIQETTSSSPGQLPASPGSTGNFRTGKPVSEIPTYQYVIFS